MKRIITAVVCLVLSQQSSGDCMNQTVEEMSYYAYMEESELKNAQCLCELMLDIKKASYDSLTKQGFSGSAGAALETVKIIGGELDKIRRVLKKDYGVEKVQCNDAGDAVT